MICRASRWTTRLCVISANQHGFYQTRFPVDFVTNVDPTMGLTRQPMQQELGKYGKPFINRWSWADYRLPDAWAYSGDTGMTGIVIGAALGGHPVLFTGMDRNVGNRKYYWQDPAADQRQWEQQRQRAFKLNMDALQQGNRKLIELTQGAEVRACSGMLTNIFGKWDINEKLPPWKPPQLAQRFYAEGKPYTVVCPRIFLHPADPIAQGSVVTLTGVEAARFLREGKIRPYEQSA